jgi:phage gp36-like protein
MPYASEEDIELAAGGESNLVSLSDWNGDTVVDDEVIARAQAAADGFIDGHLRLRFTTAEIDALRASPTATISELAAAEAVYWMKKSRNMASSEDIEHRKERERHLSLMRAGHFRPADAPKSQRAVFVENTSPFARKNWP